MTSRRKTGEPLTLKYLANTGKKSLSLLVEWEAGRSAEVGGSVRGEPRTRTIDDILS